MLMRRCDLISVEVRVVLLGLGGSKIAKQFCDWPAYRLGDDVEREGGFCAGTGNWGAFQL